MKSSYKFILPHIPPLWVEWIFHDMATVEYSQIGSFFPLDLPPKNLVYVFQMPYEENLRLSMFSKVIYIGYKSPSDFLSSFPKFYKISTSQPEEIFTVSICNLSKYVIALFFIIILIIFLAWLTPKSPWKHLYHAPIFIFMIVLYLNLTLFSLWLILLAYLSHFFFLSFLVIPVEF